MVSSKLQAIIFLIILSSGCISTQTPSDSQGSTDTSNSSVISGSLENMIASHEADQDVVLEIKVKENANFSEVVQRVNQSVILRSTFEDFNIISARADYGEIRNLAKISGIEKIRRQPAEALDPPRQP